MNVLEAIKKLDDLNDKISALEKGIFKLELDKNNTHEARLLTEVKKDYVKEAEKLKGRLEKTNLEPEVLQRGV